MQYRDRNRGPARYVVISVFHGKAVIGAGNGIVAENVVDVDEIFPAHRHLIFSVRKSERQHHIGNVNVTALDHGYPVQVQRDALQIRADQDFYVNGKDAALIIESDALRRQRIFVERRRIVSHFAIDVLQAEFHFVGDVSGRIVQDDAFGQDRLRRSFLYIIRIG